MTEFRFENLCLKVTKLRLDVIYFEKCMNLKICPKFLLFRPPKLRAYHRMDNIKGEVLKNQIGLLRKELQTACNQYLRFKTRIQRKISFLEFSRHPVSLSKRVKEDHEVPEADTIIFMDVNCKFRCKSKVYGQG